MKNHHLQVVSDKGPVISIAAPEPTDAEIQAAARAMFDADCGFDGTDGVWAELDESSRRAYLYSARVALMAAREVNGR